MALSPKPNLETALLQKIERQLAELIVISKKQLQAQRSVSDSKSR